MYSAELQDDEILILTGQLTAANSLVVCQYKKNGKCRFMHAKENDSSECISTLCKLVNLMFSLGCRNALGGKSFLLSPRPLADHLKVCKRKIENFFTLKKLL